VASCHVNESQRFVDHHRYRRSPGHSLKKPGWWSPGWGEELFLKTFVTGQEGRESAIETALVSGIFLLV
jgi:hypothetical protein